MNLKIIIKGQNNDVPYKLSICVIHLIYLYICMNVLTVIYILMTSNCGIRIIFQIRVVRVKLIVIIN